LATEIEISSVLSSIRDLAGCPLRGVPSRKAIPIEIADKRLGYERFATGIFFEAALALSVPASTPSRFLIAR